MPEVNVSGIVFFFTAALLAFGFYLWKILWKGEIRKKE